MEKKEWRTIAGRRVEVTLDDRGQVKRAEWHLPHRIAARPGNPGDRGLVQIGAEDGSAWLLSLGDFWLHDTAPSLEDAVRMLSDRDTARLLMERTEAARELSRHEGEAREIGRRLAEPVPAPTDRKRGRK